MITTVNNSAEMRQALNENLSGLLTGKRKPLMVKEVNNTLGKLLCDVKMEMMQNALTGNRNTISWFDKNGAEILLSDKTDRVFETDLGTKGGSYKTTKSGSLKSLKKPKAA